MNIVPCLQIDTNKPRDDSDFEVPEKLGPPSIMRLSCDGRSVAVVFHRHGAMSGEHDKRILVLDSGTNSTMMLDFTEQQCEPHSIHWAADEPKLLALQVSLTASASFLAF